MPDAALLRHRLRLGVAVVSAALAALLVAPMGSAAAGGGGVEIDLPAHGRGFTANPASGVLEVRHLVPGGSATGIMGARNGSGAAATITVRADHVVSDENGCTHAERAEPARCSAGAGQLAGCLVFHVSVSSTRYGAYTQQWTGPGTELARPVLVTRRLAREGTVWMRITVSLPESVGNEVQSDTFGFGLLVTLQGGGAPVSTGVDGVSTASSGHSGLAVTGIGLTLFAGAGLLLIAIGLLMFGGGAGASDVRARSERDRGR